MDILNELTEITPTRNFNLLYIILDTVFLLVLLGLLIYKKRYETTIFGIFGGLLYLVVDFGGFYLASHSRTVFINGQLASTLDTFWVLLWMSMSYGFTNFVFCWVAISKDKYWKIWISMIVLWWIACPGISTLGDTTSSITTQRTTGAYHNFMAVALIFAYFVLFIVMLVKKKNFVNVLLLNLIGISVQFGWEFALLINGIRPWNAMSLQTIIYNSLVETNLGMPGILLIFFIARSFFNEDLTKVKSKEERQLGIIHLEDESLQECDQ